MTLALDAGLAVPLTTLSSIMLERENQGVRAVAGSFEPGGALPEAQPRTLPMALYEAA